jgi:thiamine-phosphate pyrophosphorylase
VNDYPEIAVRVGSDGVHIGQDDGSLAGVRAIVGEQMIVGRSTHSPDQARAALAEGFDYIGFGPLFPTPTKLGRPGIGLENIAAVQADVGSQIPVFCIGGIKRSNLPEVLAAGAKNVVIVSDLLTADDVQAATALAKRAIADCGLRTAD